MNFWPFFASVKMGQFGFGPEKKVSHRKQPGNISGYHFKDPTNSLKSWKTYNSQDEIR